MEENARQREWHTEMRAFCAGTCRAPMAGMASVERFEDLVVWQLSVRLRDAVFRHTSKGPPARDRKSCDQIRESARSAPRNIAEGFELFRPREFARFLRIARGSLGETKNHILEGAKLNYFTAVEADRMLTLQRRAHIAATRLLSYLESCKGKAPTDWPQ